MSIPKSLEINDITKKNNNKDKLSNSKSESTKHNTLHNTPENTISSIERGSYQLCNTTNDHRYVEIKYLQDFNEENKKISPRFEIPMKEAERMFNINTNIRF